MWNSRRGCDERGDATAALYHRFCVVPFGVRPARAVGAWLEAFEKLRPDQQDRVRRWIHLNRSIAHTLRIDWDVWVSDYLRPAMESPLDYQFLQVYLPEFAGLDEGAERPPAPV